jgi:hypothetical protein
MRTNRKPKFILSERSLRQLGEPTPGEWLDIELGHADKEVLWLRYLLAWQKGNIEERHPLSSLRVLGLLSLILPRRLRDEDLGDALEDLACLRRSGAPRWQLHVKVVSTVFWLSLNAVREISSALQGVFSPKKDK